MRAPRPAVVLAALAGLGIGACGGSLYDEAGVPKLANGNTCNADTQHLCAATGPVCQANTDPDHCGAACDVCPAAPAGSSRACVQGTGGVYACGFTCIAPARFCAAQNQCLEQSVTACGASCQVCPAGPQNGTEVCADQGGGSFGCDFTCAAGFFKTASGCVRPVAVAAGANHTCAIVAGGALFCWGDNTAGQLGHAGAGGTTPAQVFTGGVVTAVAAGAQHTCAVHDGVVQCWGANGSGQLGNGTTGTGGPTPVAVVLSGVTRLTAGTGHTCAVAGGAVKCWGDNALGQLGKGGGAGASVPTASLITANATDVASLVDTTCAIVSSAVQCWGANGTGQTGKGSVSTAEAAPVPVTLPAAPIQLAVGGDHACALLPSNSAVPANGGLHCWGANDLSQIGNNLSTPPVQLTPTAASKIDNRGNAFLAVAGRRHTCAARDPATLVCSGANDQAQTGSPVSVGPTLESIVSPGGNVLSASAGLDHTCALVDQTPPPAPASTVVLKCWGRNAEGQLGRDTGGAASASPLVAP